MPTEYFKIGRLVATYAFSGEMVLTHELGKKTTLPGLKALFLEDRQRRGSFLPYFIQGTRLKSDTELYLTLEGIATKEGARPLLQRDVWLPEEDFKKHAEKGAAISLLGYAILEGKETLGTVEEVIEQPHQILCRITIEGGKEAYIPLHEATLLGIHHKKREISVELPPGLLEIYR